MQTKPVQIYRITARDALPPPGLYLDNEPEAGAAADASPASKLAGESDRAALSKDCGSPTDVVGSGGNGGRSGAKFEKVRAWRRYWTVCSEWW